MILHKNIRYLRKSRGWSQEGLAEKLGYKHYTTVQKWESGVSEPPLKKAHQIAALFGVDIDVLTSVDLEAQRASVPPGFAPPPKTHKVPLVGRIACGDPITAEENIEGYVDVPDGLNPDFALRCVGNSMVDAGIASGDVVYIRAQPEVENGQIAAVRIGDEATLKRVYWDGVTLTLMPANQAFPPLTFSGPELERVRIEGRAIGYLHLYR